MDYNHIKELAALLNELPLLIYEAMQKDSEAGKEVLKSWAYQTMDIRQLHAEATRILEREK